MRSTPRKRREPAVAAEMAHVRVETSPWSVSIRVTRDTPRKISEPPVAGRIADLRASRLVTLTFITSPCREGIEVVGRHRISNLSSFGPRLSPGHRFPPGYRSDHTCATQQNHRPQPPTI